MLDIMNPLGMFVNGVRQREYSVASDPLILSGKLIPEFFGRRNIKDMFARKPSSQSSPSIKDPASQINAPKTKQTPAKSPTPRKSGEALSSQQNIPIDSTRTIGRSPSNGGKKRTVAEAPRPNNAKRSKSKSTASAVPKATRGQQSLEGFFQSRAATAGDTARVFEGQEELIINECNDESSQISQPTYMTTNNETKVQTTTTTRTHEEMDATPGIADSYATSTPPSTAPPGTAEEQASVHDPIETKETWSRLFTKPAVPRCDGHDEPCITLLTKKPGMNLGRSFWMCPRPLGPSGAKEKNTQWRCQTFIWCSDWNPNSNT